MTRPNEVKLGSFTSVQRVRPTLQVREQLLAAIERGDYPPGSALPSERALCETFGVSRVSVREAIAGLESLGLVRVEQGRGAFVRDTANETYAGPFAKYLTMHREELVELLKVRGALDELAAVEAVAHAAPAGLKAMRAAEQAFRSAVAVGETDLRKLADLDVAFHMSVAELGQGVLLPRLLGELNGVLDESRRVTLSRPGQLERSAIEHAKIADAVEAGDGKGARQAVRTHLGHIRKWVGEFKVEEEEEEEE